MTLRHRLLQVYLIVVLLSVATVGFAIFELRHAHQIIGELTGWNKIVLDVEKLKSDWPPPPDAQLKEIDLQNTLTKTFKDLSGFQDTLDTQRVREELHTLYDVYHSWSRLPENQRPNKTDKVRTQLNNLSRILEYELDKLNIQAVQQNIRTRMLLVVVICLTLLHVFVIGALLKRWLLYPMEQLNRQVEALAHDQPPVEPLLTSPQEMANLAQALDRARISLGQLRRQLIESERMTTIGQFAAQLAHNLRNPLASIRAIAQMTARQSQDNEPASQHMHEIINSVDRLNHWVEGLMEVARRDPTPTQCADIVPTLHRAGQALAKELEAKDLTLQIDTPDQGLSCMHDPGILEHAIIAMITNAIEASPLGQTIRLRAESINTEEQNSPICRISVIDKGAGIQADNPDQIFEFSYSTKQRGMGLGLALAKLALQRQGGTANALNNPEGGATVYVELPINDDKNNNQ